MFFKTFCFPFPGFKPSCIIYLVFKPWIFNSCVVFVSLCFQNMCFQLEAPPFMFLHTVPFTFVGVFAKSCMRRS